MEIGRFPVCAHSLSRSHHVTFAPPNIYFESICRTPSPCRPRSCSQGVCRSSKPCRASRDRATCAPAHIRHLRAGFRQLSGPLFECS